MPGLQSDLLLTPRDSQKPPGARQLVPGITCCHPVCREVGRWGWLPSPPSHQGQGSDGESSTSLEMSTVL